VGATLLAVACLLRKRPTLLTSDIFLIIALHDTSIYDFYNAVRIGSDDGPGHGAVAERILRSPFSLEKRRYQATTGTIICPSKTHPALKRNLEVASDASIPSVCPS